MTVVLHIVNSSLLQEIHKYLWNPTTTLLTQTLSLNQACKFHSTMYNTRTMYNVPGVQLMPNICRKEVERMSKHTAVQSLRGRDGVYKPAATFQLRCTG